jgi:predicted SprT family Zn-dependent metalloprotease
MTTNCERIQRIQGIFEGLAEMHNLSKDWSFGFDNAKIRAGITNDQHKSISLSKRFIEIAKMPEIINTILHEIAHALVGCNHQHDAIWHKKATEIGCDGNRCYSNKISKKLKENTPIPWKLCCPCGAVSVNRYRRVAKMTNRCCRKCNKKIYFVENR